MAAQIMWSLCFVSIFIISAYGRGCMPTICNGNPHNTIRPCPDSDGSCGAYGGYRSFGRLIEGVDLTCKSSRSIYAPFDGTISVQRPFRNGACTDKGVKIVGSGTWQGYVATISFVIPQKYGGTVKAQDVVALSFKGDECKDEAPGVIQSTHIMFELEKEGRPVDPTHFLCNCSCTGQICSTNPTNEFVGKPFSQKQGVGHGYNMKCPDPPARGGEQEKAIIYSPIKGNRMGRFRPRTTDQSQSDRAKYDCDNDGIFIVGAAEWENYSVRIYNVRFTRAPGHYLVNRGDQIGYKINCKKDDTVFMEIRHYGRMYNMTDLVSGENCKRSTAYGRN